MASIVVPIPIKKVLKKTPEELKKNKNQDDPILYQS